MTKNTNATASDWQALDEVVDELPQAASVAGQLTRPFWLELQQP